MRENQMLSILGELIDVINLQAIFIDIKECETKILEEKVNLLERKLKC